MVRSKMAEAADDKGDEILKIIGHRLRTARVAAKLTQKELGEKIGNTQTYMYELETGRINTTIRTLLKLTTVLGIELRDLLPESRSAALAIPGVEKLMEVWGRVATLLAERHDQQKEETELLAQLLKQLHEFINLRAALERPPATTR